MCEAGCITADVLHVHRAGVCMMRVVCMPLLLLPLLPLLPLLLLLPMLPMLPDGGEAWLLWLVSWHAALSRCRREEQGDNADE